METPRTHSNAVIPSRSELAFHLNKGLKIVGDFVLRSILACQESERLFALNLQFFTAAFAGKSARTKFAIRADGMKNVQEGSSQFLTKSRRRIQQRWPSIPSARKLQLSVDQLPYSCGGPY
jgi:hypothetical protein